MVNPVAHSSGLGEMVEKCWIFDSDRLPIQQCNICEQYQRSMSDSRLSTSKSARPMVRDSSMCLVQILVLKSVEQFLANMLKANGLTNLMRQAAGTCACALRLMRVRTLNTAFFVQSLFRALIAVPVVAANLQAPLTIRV